MSLPSAGSAVRPSRCPATFHCAVCEPELENSTTVESRPPAPGLPEGTGSPLVPTWFWKPTKIMPPRPVMSSGWVTDACPLGVLILIGVPEDNAVLLKPLALPVDELAVLLVLDGLALLLVLDEPAVLLDLLPEPQPVSTAAAIAAAARRLPVDARARRGFFKLEDVMVGSALSEGRSGKNGRAAARATEGEATRATAPVCRQLVNAGPGRRQRRRAKAPSEMSKDRNSRQFCVNAAASGRASASG